MKKLLLLLSLMLILPGYHQTATIETVSGTTRQPAMAAPSSRCFMQADVNPFRVLGNRTRPADGGAHARPA